MGKFFICFNWFGKKLDRKQYVKEIFDSLDLDGSQTLEADELGIIWNIYAVKQLERLHNEIKLLEQKDANHLLKLYSNGKAFNSKTFSKMIKNLNIPDDDLAELWKVVKTPLCKVVSNGLQPLEVIYS